jgi:methyl-accepting chemotaxis protein
MPPHAVPLSGRLWATALLALIGSVALLLVSVRTIDSVKIRGPLYQDIVSYKDLLADILPPPAYLIESYLTCFELMKAKPSEQAELLKRLQKLELDYRERNAFWNEGLKHAGLRKAMLDEATPPALSFFTTLKAAFIPAVQKGEMESANKILEGPLTATYREHRAAVDKTVDLANAEVLVVEQAADATMTSNVRSLVISAVVINLMVLALTFFSIRSIMKPMNSLTRYAQRVSGGDYECQCEINAGHEIGNLAAVLTNTVAKVKESIIQATHSERMAQSEAQKAREASAKADEARTRAEHAKQQGMQDAALKLERVVQIVGTASEQLAAEIEQSSKGAQAQAQKAAEVATAMGQMNMTVMEVAQNAARTSETSSLAQTRAKEGASVVRKVIQGMGTVQASAISLKSQIADLGAQSEGIGKILNVISDIADQTNLLALNAAIEAARAGDAGRGFAVVADEVRKLAEKTMTATKQVGDAIKSVQESTRANIKLVDEAVSSITGATELAGLSGQSLTDIVELVGTATDQVQAIASAAGQQSAASEEINRAIDEVNAVAKESSEAMHDATRAVLELTRQATALRDLILELKSADPESELQAIM